ncbi:MAG: hypothetical protein ABJA62_08540 [Luteimonas sp.]
MRRALLSSILILACAVLALLALAGGYLPQSVGMPDLHRLYMASMRSDQQPPVILIHGVYGAKLRGRDGHERWPGGLRGLLFPSFQALALPIDAKTLAVGDDGTRAYALFDRVLGRDFYGAIVRTLEHAGGYVRGIPGHPMRNRGRQYYVFLYDWRRDDIESARALDALIERIRADYGQPKLRVDIVAHSNGGLIARYYARYGRADLLDGNDFPVTQAGAAKIRRLILLGTPNFGSVSAVMALIEGNQVGPRRMPPELLLTMPSTYELLPHALTVWLIDGAGRPLPRDIFDVELWRQYRWGVFDPALRERVRRQYDDPAAGERHLKVLERFFAKQLERARRFSWSLSVAEPANPLRLVVLGGDCEKTPARLLLENVDGRAVPRQWPGDIAHPQPGVDYDALMLEPGDGTVTKSSLLARDTLDPATPRNPDSHFPLDYPVFLCEHHTRLAGNPSFQDNLLQALLSTDR